MPTTQPESSQPGQMVAYVAVAVLDSDQHRKRNDDVEVEGQSLLLMEEERSMTSRSRFMQAILLLSLSAFAGQMFFWVSSFNSV